MLEVTNQFEEVSSEMCGRFTRHSPREALASRFCIPLAELDPLAMPPSYNVAPSQDVLVVALGRDGERKARRMRWGLVPHWAPEPRIKIATINARAESAASSRLYADAYRRRRCLILADGFYEWQKDGSDRRAGKTPFWFARPDGAPFAFAGLYSVWRSRTDPDTPPLLSCSILTTDASALVAPIHARMPVILQPESEAAWIDRNLQAPDDVASLLKPAGPALRAQAVSTRVNTPANDDAQLIQPVPEGGG